MESKQINDISTEDYITRVNNRIGTFGKSTMGLLVSFMTDGDDYDTAKQKVTDLSDEIAAIGTSAVAMYWAGNTQPLIDAVNASLLLHMTDEKKLIVTDILAQS